MTINDTAASETALHPALRALGEKLRSDHTDLEDFFENGTVVLHVCPEAAAGGNFAVVQNGDMIELDIPNRRLHVNVSDEELEARRKAYKDDESNIKRGYAYLYLQHVEQAHLGADFDFLRGGSGSIVSRESH